MSSRLDRLDHAIAGLELFLASAALAVVLVVALGTVAARTLEIATSEWVLELPMELLVVTAVFGSGLLIREERHLSVDLLVSRLRERWRHRLLLGTKLLLLALTLFLCERALQAAIQAHRAGLTLPELFDLPRSLPPALASLGFSFWGIHLLTQLVRDARR